MSDIDAKLLRAIARNRHNRDIAIAKYEARIKKLEGMRTRLNEHYVRKPK